MIATKKLRSVIHFLTLGLITTMVIFVCINLFLLVDTQPDILQAKIMAISISKGESYMGKLRLWKIYALHQDWSHADALALELDPADTLYYRSLYSPISIKNQINTLIFSTQKNAESFITLSQLYLRLGDVQGAKNALLQAQKLDPIRDDIPTLLSTLN